MPSRIGRRLSERAFAGAKEMFSNSMAALMLHPGWPGKRTPSQCKRITTSDINLLAGPFFDAAAALISISVGLQPPAGKFVQLTPFSRNYDPVMGSD
jgi:hypothetical protein